MNDWHVACLCAAWCGSCRDYRAVFDTLATATPWARFHWIDIEDESDALGELDIETFPTLLVAHGTQALFFGPMLPHAQALQRLLAQLKDDPRPQPGTDATAQRLAALITTRA